MATRIAFSTHFPDRMGELAGKPTYFQEKIWSGLQYTDHRERTVLYNHYSAECRKFPGSDWPNEWPNILWQYPPKTTTIRSNYDYWKSKEGKLIQPFFWSGKPRKSKQVVFCPEVRLARVRKINLNPNGFVPISIAETPEGFGYYVIEGMIEMGQFTQNEGFDHPDHFWMWFDKYFNGALLELESAKQ